MNKSVLIKRVKGSLRFVPDREYLILYYFIKGGGKLNLKNPQTFNEKLNWLKLHDKNPLYTKLVDKFEVKAYVAKVIGEEYIIPTLGLYKKFDDIIFDQLPNKFVLKCTHDSEGIVIVKDKNRFDVVQAKQKIERALSYNYFVIGREWPYKNIEPRIIAEQYMEDKETGELRDYKFFCFDGDVKALFIASDRFNNDINTHFDFFDADFNRLPFTQGNPNSDVLPAKPVNFDLMKELASKLSKGIPHVRVDLYEINGKVYFGELTFYHFSGMVPFNPPQWDRIFGDWIDLSKVLPTL